MPPKKGRVERKRQLCVAVPLSVALRLEGIADHECIPLAAVVRRAVVRDLRRSEPDVETERAAS